MSDEFDGYVVPDEIPADGFDDVVVDYIDEQEFDESVPPTPDFHQPTGPSGDMTDKSPLDFFKLVTDEMLDCIELISMLNNTLTQPPPSTLVYTAGIRESTTELSSRSSWPFSSRWVWSLTPMYRTTGQPTGHRLHLHITLYLLNVHVPETGKKIRYKTNS